MAYASVVLICTSGRTSKRVCDCPYQAENYRGRSQRDSERLGCSSIVLVAAYWFVHSDEEERRTIALLGLEHMSDYHELDFLGFYVSGPPLSRPRCRKEAEFLDW